MRHAVIVAHPKADSFTLTMARAYQAAAEAAGHWVVLRDLYRTGFDPRLPAEELPGPKGFSAAADVRSERAYIGAADVFVFVYPLWVNSPPAMMKGYMERVFGMGFGYAPSDEGGDEPLLCGRQMISITSSGAPESWLVETGAWAALKVIFENHIANVCGLRVTDHLHFGDIVPGITSEAVQDCASQVGKMFESHFHASSSDAA